MDSQIKEVQDYFINKIIERDYNIVDSDGYTVTISIDKKYYFEIWISNGANNIRTYNNSFMQLDFITEQKEKIMKDLERDSNGSLKKNLLKQQKQIAEKLNNLK